jgi:F-type H+-transporting ATPase subunit epsilon
MSTIHLDIITAEREMLSEDVEIVLAPGTEGQLGILPRHAPLLTGLQAGELCYRKDGQLISMVITGGFMEVIPTRVTVLADAAERADDIDIARAEAARQRALARMDDKSDTVDAGLARVALMRAMVRLKVARKRRSSQG